MKRLVVGISLVALLMANLVGPDPAGAALPGSLHYVTSSLKVGSTVAEADSYGFNLDNDSRGIVDNALGHVLAGLSSQLDIDGALAQAIDSGQVVMLDVLDADSLTADKHATWHIVMGTPQPNPVLTGGGHFTVDPGQPANVGLSGPLMHGKFIAKYPNRPFQAPVAIQLGLVPGRAPVVLHLSGAQLLAHCTKSGCTGKIGGGISPLEMNTVLLPALAKIMTHLVHQSCSIKSPDTCSDDANRLLSLFDTNHDFVISGAELRANALIQAILQPDVDLYGADGGLGQDGVKDSVSIGLGFTTSRAVFDA